MNKTTVHPLQGIWVAAGRITEHVDRKKTTNVTTAAAAAAAGPRARGGTIFLIFRFMATRD